MHSFSELSETRNARRGALSVGGAFAALLGAVVLSFLFYRAVGFPANLPLAFGSAVLLAELAELILREGSAAVTPGALGRALVHGIGTALACWLGVWVVRTLGWMG